ncbi:alanine--glyoxylate aminotransferase [Caldinitratiruptor microaerophilus]|uniref:Alanine--glyoxylate aminotransferase n=1 Tax=Caldinitratiruptor microaerophilus TaxID=671077 RepID=A0AA35CMT6_9FIRM|nr:alanine--glyoxylate aminotransferase [Caldinitratiruptor microaerophilus]
MDPRVLRAMATPVIGHLDPAFLAVMDDVSQFLRQVFRTRNEFTLPLSGTGTAGMEAVMVNLLEPGDEVLVGVAGYFGQRMAEVARRAGARVQTVEAEWGTPLDPDRIEAALRERPARVVAFVHAETSTGVLQPPGPIVEVAHRHGALAVADCVTSLGSVPVEVDAWGLDAAYSCSQKGLGAPPGMAPVTFGERALERIRSRKSPVQSFYLDMTQLMAYWGDGARDRAYHHTAPISMIYALREALRLVLEEGLEARWERIGRVHRMLVAGLEAMGLRMLVAPEYRLAPLNTVVVPEGIDAAAVQRRLLDFDIEIASGFGPLKGKIWRVGFMGVNAEPKNVLSFLAAFETALREQGLRLEPGAGLAAAAAAAG